MAWINLFLGAYALWRAADLKHDRKSGWSWGSMLAAGLALLTSSGLRFAGLI